MDKVNNFDQILNLLDFSDDDKFYYIELIARKKDNPNKKNSRSIKTYYIWSKQRFLEYKPEIIKLCDTLNARAYIRLNRRSWEYTAMKSFEHMGKYASHGEYKSFRKAFFRVLGNNPTEDKRVWVIDFDKTTKRHVEHVRDNLINSLHNEIQKDYKTLDIIRTSGKHNFHLLSHPFNSKKFGEIYKYEYAMEPPSIHKKNPTILYNPNV